MPGYVLPNNSSSIASVLKMPNRTKGLQIDYWGNMLPYGYTMTWDKRNLYNNTKNNQKTKSWLMNKP